METAGTESLVATLLRFEQDLVGHSNRMSENMHQRMARSRARDSMCVAAMRARYAAACGNRRPCMAGLWTAPG